MSKSNTWRVYDKSVGLVAFENCGSRAGAQEVIDMAPEIIRGDMVVLAPGEATPTNGEEDDG